MDAYQLTATVMRALRLFALIVAMGVVANWGPIAYRVVRRVLRRVPIAVAAIAGDVGAERDRACAMVALFALAVFLFQVGFLAPLPELAAMRVWAVGLVIVIATLLWSIYHYAGQDPRFSRRRTIRRHVAIALISVLFAYVTR